MYTESKDKVAAVMSYFSWIFWVIAFLIRNKDDALSRIHLNQGLILALIEAGVGILSAVGGLFGFIGALLGIGTGLLSVLGIIRAVQGSAEPLPIVGGITLL